MSKQICTSSPPLPCTQLCGHETSPLHFPSARLTVRFSVSEPVGLMSTWSSSLPKMPASLQNGWLQSSLSQSSIERLAVPLLASTVWVNVHGGLSGMKNGKMNPVPNSKPKSRRLAKLSCFGPPSIVTPA